MDKLYPHCSRNNLFDYTKLPKNYNLKTKARELRKAGNLAEVIFWQTFKDKENLGFDIDRQYIIGNYIVDFFIAELGLVFEIDGQSHDTKGDYDAEREQYLSELNLKIIHFSDRQIRYQINEVKLIVMNCIENRCIEFI
jgi:very-short-patch-repair endonuclease